MGFVDRNFRRFWGRLRMRADVPKEIPLPNLLHKMFDWVAPGWRDCWLDRSVKICRANYNRTIKRIRNKIARGEKVRVLFLVQCSAKWKAQSVYDALRADDRFDPCIAISHPIESQHLSPRETKARQNEVRRWFEAAGNACVIVYDALKDRHLNLRHLGADIVFYPEASYPAQSPVEVSRFALTCYIPYYVPNYGDKFLDTGLPNHRLFFRYFVLNDDWITLYERWMAGRNRAGEFVASGHPMLDQIHFESDFETCRKTCVVYAPHWTFTHPGNPTILHFGTFTWSGKEILEYAQLHGEFEWIFKPHPNLRSRLVSSGFMSANEVDAYYDAWKGLGAICDEGGYASLFDRSTMMITDCGSFLSEYAATGKPIIHLISLDNSLIPPAASKSLYDTYYKVHDIAEMHSVFRKVLECGVDDARGRRQAAAKKANLIGGNAARRIQEYLRGLLN